MKPTKKTGILWFVKEFEDLANLAEKIFERAERRSDLNRAYTKLIRAVYSGIDKCSDQSEKTPPEVIRFQNFHNCFAVLSSLKIEVGNFRNKINISPDYSSPIILEFKT